jgi:predicted DNA-binding transcriptional regulator AlpA
MSTELLDLNDLASMLGRSPETIKKDISRNHLAVPPRLHIPGTRMLRWRRVDVDTWLASHVEQRDVEGRGDRQEGDFQSTTPTMRCMVPFTLTNANTLELLAGFRRAAVSVGWSKEAAFQTAFEAISGDYEHLHATLAVWCQPVQMSRETK